MKKLIFKLAVLALFAVAIIQPKHTADKALLEECLKLQQKCDAQTILIEEQQELIDAAQSSSSNALPTSFAAQ